MPVWPNDYIENVVDDIAKNSKNRKPVKAGLIERCAVRHCSPTSIHPNPNDEFSQPDIGPNLQIVGGYVKEIQYDLNLCLPIFEEPLIVQKLEHDGYLLINGHHRWFAALRMKIDKIRIKIVNLIGETDLHRMVKDTQNSRLASFDFDEILLSTNENDFAPIVDPLFSRKIKERLRAGAPEVIRAFQNAGYDICVYSSYYFTEEDFEDFFSMYDLKVNIVVNGINEKRKNTSGDSTQLQDILRNKYKKIAHVDNDSIICTDTVAKNYESYEISDNTKNWQDGITGILETIG